MDDRLARFTSKKNRLSKLQSPLKELIKNLEEWVKVELTYSSNAIEGNTLSRIETAEIIERGIDATISGKPFKDQLEAINHAKAVEFVKDLATKRKSHQFITEEDILAIHKIILRGIMDDWVGKYRKTQVFIRGVDVEFPDAKNVPQLMKKFIEWLADQQNKHPVRVASDSHLKFESIHPFVDGNGRVGRLLMNLILQINGYPMTIIRMEERTEYLKALNTAQTKGSLTPLYDLIENSLERSLDAYINAAEGKAALSALSGELKHHKERLLKVGELAKLANEGAPTIRFWTREGLLKVAKYSEGGYQLYDIAQIDRVKEIRHLQENQRLTLSEIKQKLGI